MELAELIRNTFPVHPIPDSEAVVEDTYCVEHLHEILAGRPWDEPSARDYRMCDDGFSLLTVSGLGYYLPGYLTAKLDDPEAADILGEYVTYTLGGTSNFCRTRMSELGTLMNRDKCDAILAWLDWYEACATPNAHIERSRKTVRTWE
ncbi:DUF6714 family protein [Rhodopirellula sallentina]|uniref:Uncharacterized protein n=1 Tax=Rhodopirellula sallentina SM41 TaxID=1263870 RepID=M5TRV5_9BACT|nr:DUF6714 family protein [Rhodopirellula sallentina]EMI51890.1 hypothetical protein RSSM_06678 [Rhodopirellula sallentina SM41]